MKTTNRKGLTVTRRDFINNVTSVGVVMGASSRVRELRLQQCSSASAGHRFALRQSAPLRILVIVAHGDDMEYNIGGTVAKWVAEGHEVFRAAVTDSARGSFEAGMTVEKLAKIGVDEAEAAARVLGLKGNFFLGFPDGMTKLADEEAVRAEADAADSPPEDQRGGHLGSLGSAGRPPGP